MTDDQNQDDGKRVDAIRDILFGQQMRQYDERFAALEAQLRERLSAAEQDTARRLTELREASAAELKTLREQAQSQGSEVESALGELTENLSRQRDELLTSLSDQLHAAERKAVSRQDLAQWLRELADQIDTR